MFFLAMIAMAMPALATILVVDRSGLKERALPETVSLSFVLGSGITVLEMFVLYLLGIKFTLAHLSILPLISTALVLYLCLKSPADGEGACRSDNRKMSLLEKLLLAGIVMQVLWVMFLTFPMVALSHDAAANYALKAKMFFLNNGIPAGFFAFSEETVAHPDYPPFVPFIMTFIYMFTGLNENAVLWVMPFFYTAFIVLLYFQTRRFFSRAFSLLCVFIFAGIQQVADYATVIHTDLVLSLFVTCGFIYFFSYVAAKKPEDLILAAVFLGFSVWIKNEAVVFFSIFIVSAGVCVLRDSASGVKGKVMRLAAVLLTLLILGCPWFVYKSSTGVTNSDINSEALTGERIMQNAKDIPVLLDIFQEQVFGPKKWNIFWVLFFAAMVWKRKELWKGNGAYIMFFLVSGFLGYFMGYMLTTGANLFFYANTTMSRFMIHFAGLALFFMAYYCYDDVKDTFKTFGDPDGR